MVGSWWLVVCGYELQTTNNRLQTVYRYALDFEIEGVRAIGYREMGEGLSVDLAGCGAKDSAT